MKKSLPLVALFYSVLLFEPAFAVQTYFNTNFGDWTNAANWSTGVVPTAEDYAYNDNNRQANLIAALANSANMSDEEAAGLEAGLKRNLAMLGVKRRRRSA